MDNQSINMDNLVTDIVDEPQPEVVNDPQIAMVNEPQPEVLMNHNQK